jgi:ubiquinone/menaquinone biosynthesis C-methylase UbiE
VLAPKFIRFKHVLVDGLTQHSEAVFPSLPVRQGDRVLDVGCGFGDTAIKLAGWSGRRARSSASTAATPFSTMPARTSRLSGLTQHQVDARRCRGRPARDQFDFVFARFGTMFFANPVAGLRNMRKALRPGGRMVHIVWRGRADNPWLSMAKDIVLQFLPPPGDDAQTCGPGPFSMSDEETVRAMMKAAGYSDIEFAGSMPRFVVGSDVSDAIAFQLAIGPAGEVFREAGEEAENKRGEIEAALAEAIERQKTSPPTASSCRARPGSSARSIRRSNSTRLARYRFRGDERGPSPIPGVRRMPADRRQEGLGEVLQLARADAVHLGEGLAGDRAAAG